MYIRSVTTSLVYETFRAEFPALPTSGIVFRKARKGKIYLSLPSNVDSVTMNVSASVWSVKFNKFVYSSS